LLSDVDERYCIIVNMTKKRELVVRVLKNNSDGLTIVEIAKKLRISRNTVAVVLAELKGANLIRIRSVGMAKLHYLRKGGKK
jgi:DNA-binding transcriptional regulator LsrR (DeoR family)